MNAKHLLIACATLSMTTAFADVTVRTVNEKDGTPFSVTYITNGQVRSENLQGQTPAFVLWKVGSNQMTTVMPSRKTYMVMDAAQVAAQMKQANDQMKQVEQQMASLPPQMREMMKKNMPNMGTGKPLIEMKVTKTGKSDTKGGYACQMVDIAITGIPMAGDLGQEHCVADPAKLGISSADLNTLKQMAEMAKQMTKDLGNVVGGMPDVFEMGGWPVWTRDKHTGDVSVIKTVTKGGVDASLFSIPAGYTQEQMPSMPSMGGMGGEQPGGGKKKKKKNG